jgi:hypothetical protein
MAMPKTGNKGTAARAAALGPRAAAAGRPIKGWKSGNTRKTTKTPSMSDPLKKV